MFQRENSNFTGFVVTYSDGTFVCEYQVVPNKPKTNWGTLDRGRVEQLDLYWKGLLKASIRKGDYPGSSSESWLYFHTGFMDIGGTSVKIISRNIGVSIGGVDTIYSVNEDSGSMENYQRNR